MNVYHQWIPNIEAGVYSGTLSWECDSKKKSCWQILFRHSTNSSSSFTVKCVFISHFFYIPAGVPQHLFSCPRDSPGSPRGPRHPSQRTQIRSQTCQSWRRVSGSWVKWVDKFGWVTWIRYPLTHFTLYSSGIPRDFLVHGKQATAIITVILTVC